jgi:hypothetical protein
MNVAAAIETTTVPFTDAVAARCERDVSEVASVLAKHSVAASPSPPPAKPLRINRISFSGEKKLDDKLIPFAFSWDVAETGFFAVMSSENLRGKTTIIQVALWALRGTIKDLTTTVKNWIQSVEVSFQAGQREVRVAFTIIKGIEHGTVSVRTANAAEGEAEVLNFSDGEQFKRAMEEVMLESLALESIPASRKTGDRITAYDDGWAAYTGAFLTDSKSDAIIGENIPGTDLTQRLLQVFVGLPWARTLFQARSRRKVLESEIQRRKRKLTTLGGHSLDDLETELADVRLQIQDESVRNGAAKRLLLAQRDYDSCAQETRDALTALRESRQEAEAAKSEKFTAEKSLREMEEERAAAAFFGRLSPKCCPRCSAVIPKERLERETSEHSCSVCLETVPVPDDEIIEAEIALAKRRLTEAKALEKDALLLIVTRDHEYNHARAGLSKAGQLLNNLASSGTAGDLQVLERRRERLEGMLEVANAVVNADLADSDDLAILQAAEDEAQARIGESSGHVLTRIAGEVKRIVKRLGMHDVESVELKRNAHVSIVKGGTTSAWNGLSPGEQLRVRIATVVALVRIARDHGVGRHPGLLMIDSPGKEEVAEENLAGMLDELQNLTKEVGGLQMFVVLRGTPDLFSGLPADRIRSAGPGEYLW